MVEYPVLIIYMVKSKINPFPWFLLFYITSHNLNLKRIASANRNQCIIISFQRNTKWISTLKIKCITCIIWMAFRIASNYCNDDNNGWITESPLFEYIAIEWKWLDNQQYSSSNFVCILKSMQNEYHEPFAFTFQQQIMGYIISNRIYFDCTLVTEFIVLFLLRMK